MKADVSVANAPVSFGVYGLPEDDDGLPSGAEVLAATASAGYDGIDLGPVGYFGDRDTIAPTLQRHGLSLAGGWVDLHFATGEGFADDLAVLDTTLDVFEAAATVSSPPPVPTLADSGSDQRRRHPGGGATMPSLRLTPRQWEVFGHRVDEVVGRCRDRGLEPTFHPHACTYVESPDEVEQLLEVTDVGLCLDTGHVALGGGDPPTCMQVWGNRINHLHVKDVDLGVLDEVRAQGGDMEALWGRNGFRELGAGDAVVDGFLDVAEDQGYAGWIVVEQDLVPGPDTTLEGIDAAQRRNRAWLAERGW